jgi:hypothetical protein
MMENPITLFQLFSFRLELQSINMVMLMLQGLPLMHPSFSLGPLELELLLIVLSWYERLVLAR